MEIDKILLKLAYKSIIKIRCLFNKHEKIFWSDQKCDQHNVMTGIFRPWECIHCDIKSSIFYPSTPKMPKVKEPKLSEKEEEVKKLKICIEKVPIETHVLINFNDEIGDELYSIEKESEIGNWIASFDRLKDAERFIEDNKWIYNRKYDFRDSRSLELWNKDDIREEYDLNFNDLKETNKGIIKSKECLNSEILIKESSKKDYSKNIQEVTEFAIKDNHIILSKCIEMYNHFDEITWEETMQVAAIELSKQLKLNEEKIIDLVNRK